MSDENKRECTIKVTLVPEDENKRDAERYRLLQAQRYIDAVEPRRPPAEPSKARRRRAGKRAR